VFVEGLSVPHVLDESGPGIAEGDRRGHRGLALPQGRLEICARRPGFVDEPEMAGLARAVSDPVPGGPGIARVAVTGTILLDSTTLLVPRVEPLIAGLGVDAGHQRLTASSARTPRPPTIAPGREVGRGAADPSRRTAGGAGRAVGSGSGSCRALRRPLFASATSALASLAPCCVSILSCLLMARLPVAGARFLSASPPRRGRPGSTDDNGISRRDPKLPPLGWRGK
jgi:hypothetical protein